MISLLPEGQPNNHYWLLECDSCGYTITYGYDSDISGWVFRKSSMTMKEKHLCPSCKSN